MVCVAGAAGLCGAALWFSAVSSVLAAPVSALALPLPTDWRRTQVLWQVHAVGAGRSAAAESDERLVRDGNEIVKLTRSRCYMREYEC